MEDRNTTQLPSMSLMQAQSESADASQDTAQSLFLLLYKVHRIEFRIAPLTFLVSFIFGCLIKFCCVSESCQKTITMSLSPQETAYQEAHIDDDRRVNVVISMVICLTAAWTAVILRLVSRRLAKCSLQMDDYVILVGLVRAKWIYEYFVRLTNDDMTSSSSLLCLQQTVSWVGLETKWFCSLANANDEMLMLIGIRYGLGRHFILVKTPENFAKVCFPRLVVRHWRLILKELDCLRNIVQSRNSNCEVFDSLRIFPSRRFGLYLLATGLFIFSYTTAATFTFIFQCIPVNALWRPSISHRCIAVGPALTAMGSLNIITDAVILGLPLPLLWKLNTTNVQKLQLMGIFLTGGLWVPLCICYTWKDPK